MNRVEATLKVKGWTTRTLRENYDRHNFDLELLPVKTSHEINRLPGFAEAKTVWEEYSSTRDLATGSEGANLKELKRIVARYLNDPYAFGFRSDLPATPVIIFSKCRHLSAKYENVPHAKR